MMVEHPESPNTIIIIIIVVSFPGSKTETDLQNVVATNYMLPGELQLLGTFSL